MEQRQGLSVQLRGSSWKEDGSLNLLAWNPHDIVKQLVLRCQLTAVGFVRAVRD